MIEGVLVLNPMVFQLGGVIVPTGLNYRNKNMNAQCIFLHGGCCCLWYFVNNIIMYVSICAYTHTQFFCPHCVRLCPSVSEICIMLFDLPD